MHGTIRIQQRWPKSLFAELQRIAHQRHTTVSELIRQAAVEHYALHAIDENDAHLDANDSESGENS